MRNSMNTRQCVLQLFVFSIAPMLIPICSLENSILKMMYIVAAYQLFRLWQIQPRCVSLGDKLIRAMLVFSSVICLVMLFDVGYPLWVVLNCLLLMGQIVVLYTIETRYRLICEDSSVMFRVLRWVLTGMNLLVCAAYIYMIVVEYAGMQEPTPWYDVAVWIPILMNIPKLIIGMCVIVSIYHFCMECCREL